MVRLVQKVRQEEERLECQVRLEPLEEDRHQKREGERVTWRPVGVRGERECWEGAVGRWGREREGAGRQRRKSGELWLEWWSLRTL